MKRNPAIFIIVIMILCCSFATAEGVVSGIRDLFSTPTATPSPEAFRFRDGIRWGMNREQVKALEYEKMTERSMQDWSVMLTDEKVAVSRFTADLVFMFREDRLLMISYEFQKQAAKDNYEYLQGALGSLYGEPEAADPLSIKALMDAVNPDRYRTDLIRDAAVWKTADGTSIYLYYYSTDAFAILYVCPELGNRIYQTNGL